MRIFIAPCDAHPTRVVLTATGGAPEHGGLRAAAWHAGRARGEVGATGSSAVNAHFAAIPHRQLERARSSAARQGYSGGQPD